jgi:hypothetical protein
MKITKTTTISYEVLQAKADEPIFTYGEFKESRLKHRMSISRFEKCFGCDHSFADDEPVYFGCVKDRGNIFFCKTCVEKYDMEGENHAD